MLRPAAVLVSSMVLLTIGLRWLVFLLAETTNS